LVELYYNTSSSASLSLNFYILSFFSETTGSIETKLGRIFIGWLSEEFIAFMIRVIEQNR
jgi:hypothetical protein